ncbi:MAG: TIGR01212 family radical SAM protein [Muribaculaceae bacterium]|nr:TIGR01212 family radical SAM protein [Muribaculaceae bacterium]
MSRYWRDYSDFISSHFQGKMQKLAVNAGFSCPNRDGSKGKDGCIYCNNSSFNPSYCHPEDSVRDQIEKGKAFFSRKYPDMRYLAYFQAYTNTHSDDTERLLGLYSEACSVDGVDGIIIGTRPDCVPDRLLLALKSHLPWVMMEYGAESSHDETLRLVNRCHTWNDTVDAVARTAAIGLPVGLHLIMGLPGETEEMMLETIDAVNLLPVDVVKIHQLQILRGTPLASMNESLDLRMPTPQQYARLCAKIVRRLRPDIAIDRFVSQAPPSMLIAPQWGLKNYQFTTLVERELDLEKPITR